MCITSYIWVSITFSKLKIIIQIKKKPSIILYFLPVKIIQLVFEPQSITSTEKSGLFLDVGMKPCSNKSQWALIVVMSAPHHVTIREIIRKTWGQDMFLDRRISLVFFLGLSPLDFVDNIVLEESKFTQDIVRVGKFMQEPLNFLDDDASGKINSTKNCERDVKLYLF